MTIPTFTPALDGILAIANIVTLNAQWSQLLAPDGSGRVLSVDVDGGITYVAPDDPNNASRECVISADGQKASFMPKRSGGPLPGARWWHYGLIIVPTGGL